MTLRHETPDQYREELQRVLESETLRHSESLRRLLVYLGERALSGAGTNALKEYTIGVEAFNKSQDYDPQHDPTIRVAASKLRHKLDEYYGTEGAGNPARIELPRGHYELRFSVRTPEDDGEEPPASPSSDRRWQWVSAVLATCLAALTFVHFRVQTVGPPTPAQQGELRPAGWTPELEAIWQPFLDSKRPLVISLGTPLFIKIGRDYFRNSRINKWQEAEASDQVKQLKKNLEADAVVPSHPYTGVGEATGLFLLSRFLTPRRPDMILKRNNVLTWDEVRGSNVVFLGPPKFNLHLIDIPAEDGFLIDRGAVRNPKPRPGEPDAYRNRWSEDQLELLEEYALIYRLPGVDNHGEIMMLGAASTEGSWAAVEYVTQPQYGRELVQRVRMPDGRLPAAYQVLLHVEFKAHVPFKIAYENHRILAQPWRSSRAAR